MAPISDAKQVKSAAEAFLKFLNKSVTPYHAVASCIQILKEAGFNEILEKEPFITKPGDKYYITKNESSIYAFAVGGAYQPGNGGFSMVVAHTDSPCLRVKPISKKISENFLQLGVSPYGGGLWRTWFDRDLCVAGQVVYQRGEKIIHRLVNVNHPIMNIPSLAIHLDSERSKFEFNTETHLRPILAHANCPTQCEGAEKDKTKNEDELAKTMNNCCVLNEHHDQFLQTIAEHAKCSPNEILDMDLCLYDAQPATFSGLNKEFISGARLDNLVGTYTAIVGLVNSLADAETFNKDPSIRVVACFDNEECGSGSAQGAASHFTEWLLRRLVTSEGAPPNAFEHTIANSYLISCDQAHSVHPNYPQKHEDNHKPAFHKGIVVKVNFNQRYATTAVTHSVLKVIADAADVPLQKVVVRNDSLCGSTVGPILAAKLGVQTIDIGCPQLAMHSIRELGDTSSIHHSITLFSKFFVQLPTVLKNVQRHSGGDD